MSRGKICAGQWISHYEGVGNEEDRATDIAVDASGSEDWIAKYDGPADQKDEAVAFVIDGTGNILVTGASYISDKQAEYSTVKYNSAEVEKWIARYEESGDKWANAVDIATDSMGNIYVAGSSGGSSNYTDYITIKYNPEGIEQWIARYNGPSDKKDRPIALAVDGNSNLYAAGESYRTSNSQDYATVKYNSEGVEQLLARYKGPENSSNIPVEIAVDNSGYVYVTGSSSYWDDSEFAFQDMLNGATSIYTTIKYDQTGTPVFIKHTPHIFPENFCLKHNYPNPFNPTTTIKYELPVASQVRLAIYDILGRHVRTLVDTKQEAGHFQTTWDGTDERNAPVAAGVYFCRIEAWDPSTSSGQNYVKMIKLALVR